MSYRVHLLALPNVQTTKAYSLCGFCSATIRFAKVLKRMGCEVILYASEENEAPCDELVTVITKEEQQTLLEATKPEPTPYQYAYIEFWSPIWQLANARMIKEIGKRKQPKDFICLIGGDSQRCVAEAHPELQAVEYSIGYNGSFADYRVFESYAWMHATYAAQQIPNGRFFDTVIPLFYDPADHPVREPEPFALYVGRLVPRKGIGIACEAAALAGIPLKVIGHGDTSLITHGAEYLGAVDQDTRNDWMARASVLICPTIYVEPFGGIACEAQMSGTPVVATDFGGFTETVEQGVTGYRCHTLGEFAAALRKAPTLSRERIRNRALRLYSLDAAVTQYRAYFDRLSLLWQDGWNTVEAA